MELIKTQEDLQRAVNALCLIEPRFQSIAALHGTPNLRRLPANLETLLHIVVDQFISLKAAEAIWQRVKARVDVGSSQAIMELELAALLSCGLSRNKAKTFKACAQAQVNLVEKDISILRKSLLTIWGIGPWTADIFLLSACGYSDAWPAGDVALQSAAQSLLGLPERPGAKELVAISMAWQPYRQAAALLLWAHYRDLKHLAQTPSQKEILC